MKKWRKICIALIILVANTVVYEFATLLGMINDLPESVEIIWTLSHYVILSISLVMVATIYEDTKEQKKLSLFIILCFSMTINVFIGYVIANSIILSVKFMTYFPIQLLLIASIWLTFCKLKSIVKLQTRQDRKIQISKLENNFDEDLYVNKIMSKNKEHIDMLVSGVLTAVSLLLTCILLICLFLFTTLSLKDYIIMTATLIIINSVKVVFFTSKKMIIVKYVTSENISFMIGIAIYYYYNVIKFQNSGTILFLPSILLGFSLIPMLAIDSKIGKTYLGMAQKNK
jgi:hypothetical protein